MHKTDGEEPCLTNLKKIYESTKKSTHKKEIKKSVSLSVIFESESSILPSRLSHTMNVLWCFN